MFNFTPAFGSTPTTKPLFGGTTNTVSSVAGLSTVTNSGFSAATTASSVAPSFNLFQSNAATSVSNKTPFQVPSVAAALKPAITQVQTMFNFTPAFGSTTTTKPLFGSTTSTVSSVASLSTVTTAGFSTVTTASSNTPAFSIFQSNATPIVSSATPFQLPAATAFKPAVTQIQTATATSLFSFNGFGTPTTNATVATAPNVITTPAFGALATSKPLFSSTTSTVSAAGVSAVPTAGFSTAAISGFSTAPTSGFSTAPTSGFSTVTTTSSVAPTFNTFQNNIATSVSSTTPFQLPAATAFKPAVTQIQTAPATSLFSFNGFGTPTTNATVATASNVITTPAFGTLPTSKSLFSNTTSTVSSTAGVSAVATAGFATVTTSSFSTVPTSGFSTVPTSGFSTVTTTSSVAPTFNAFQSNIATNVSSNTPFQVSTTTIALKPATTQVQTANAKMSYKDLNQALTRLILDFESQERHFLNEVDALNAYDISIRKSLDKISEVTDDVDDLEKQKSRFEYELDVVGEKQTKLTELVVAMEKALGLPDQNDSQQIELREPATPSDVQRRNILQLQVNVDAQLKLLDDDVTEIADQFLDFLKVSEEDGLIDGSEQTSTVEQIRQILCKQIDTLSWVDKESELLSKKMKSLTAKVLAMQN